MSEFDDSSVRGLPGPLPQGEHIVWQGAPDWRTLARTAMHAHWVAGYFGLLAIWRLTGGATQGEAFSHALGQAALTVLAGLVAVALLVGYAWLSARTTAYTLTNRRLVLRHGVALPKAFNIPFASVASAGLRLDRAGTGDIPLALLGDAKIAYPHLWPHVRPWRFSHPEPMLRAVPDAAGVASTLSQAMQQAARDANRYFAAETPRTESTAEAAPALDPISA